MKRGLAAISRAPLQRQFWRLYVNIFRYFRSPFRVAIMYTLKTGSYPRRQEVMTPVGTIHADLYSADDLITLVECFGKIDYQVFGDELTVVDFGSNIGLSALYFLTHAPKCHVHLFEPVPVNVVRLRENLAPFADRISLNQQAIGLVDGTADFVVEPTGRYGALGDSGPNSIRVDVADASRVLRAIAHAAHGIDVLKLDIEGFEAAVLKGLPEDLLIRIRLIYAELFDEVVSLNGFGQARQGAVVRFERTAASNLGR